MSKPEEHTQPCPGAPVPAGDAPDSFFYELLQLPACMREGQCDGCGRCMQKK